MDFDQKLVFQQDGATCHTSVRSQSWCERNFKYFLKKEHWPANSPDVTPLDYYYWNAIVTRMNYLEPARTTREDFINEIKRAADTNPLEEIKKAVNSFPKRIRNLEDKSEKKKEFVN